MWKEIKSLLTLTCLRLVVGLCLMSNKVVKKNPRGHACSRDCCDDPDIECPEHKCLKPNEFCEKCYVTECQNCWACCACDL